MPANATHLRAIPGGRADAVSGAPASVISAMDVESLFREHHDRVFRAAYRITGSVVDAEDVLQTVFLRLSRRAEINLEPNPASYLHRAALNASLDLIRQRGRSELIPIDDVAPVLSGSAALDPETQRAGREMRARIRQAISKLGEKSAEMFVLKYFEGYGNNEIAELMGTSAMVVGVLLHRARTRVKKEIGDLLEGGQA
ncbi:MAG TPA: sigma-70 family RNA polymerase sigma factor [Blastocatellia bacterium]|nr:sigma-70 family RNA polymerase sigma factor [Blastocatellia bacterium]HMV83026.1 sigma-70 family RNA polymerase sigma factor [Blastocatellia bacterium]HMX26635.1 sigma-70 family RNA polymerase sigma factor [Blastocatellia bacterium]HMY72153.1 sigma-70 family RNA polymerase sigma factor [Blastocatellia bacterium]HMZ18954.1 sigma-70 family RNA polymerase sigma factor [Blastocatellia bacterium]